MPNSVIDHIGSVYKFLNIDQDAELQDSLERNELFIPFANTSVADFNLMIIGSRPTNGRTLFMNELIIANTLLNERSLASDRKRKRILAYFLTEQPVNYFNKLITGKLSIPGSRLRQMMTNPKSDIVAAEVFQLDFDLHLYPLFVEFNLPRDIKEFTSRIESDIEACHPDFIFIDGLETLGIPEIKKESDYYRGVREIDIWLDACLEINRKHLIPFVITRLLIPFSEIMWDLHNPVLGDFNSGMIDSDCDMVIFMARPSYFGQYDEQNPQGQDKSIQFHILRDRSGTLSGKYQCEIDYEIPRMIFPKE